MSRTWKPLTGDGADFDNIVPYINDTGWGYQDAEWVRQALDIIGYMGFRHDLGGAEIPIEAGSWRAVMRSTPATIIGENVQGLDAEVVVYYGTSDVATSVQWRLWDKTNSAAIVTGTLHNADTDIQEAIEAITLEDPATEYELQVQGGNTTNGVMAWGYIRLRKMPE